MQLELPGYAEDRAKRRALIPEWITAAASGNVDAQLKLAWEYARGDVVDADMTAARDWFERAAASGQEEALVSRARFLQLRGVPEGIRELRKFAYKGNWKAQFWLARYYESRSGRLNQLRAAAWYDRSLNNGGDHAAKLAKLWQLTRIAPLKSKAIFAGKGIVEAVAVIWRMSRHESQIELYEPLLYGLKNRGR